jgi:hypothetical protein
MHIHRHAQYPHRTTGMAFRIEDNQTQSAQDEVLRSTTIDHGTNDFHLIDNAVSI